MTVDTYRSVDRTAQAIILFDEFRGQYIVEKYDGFFNHANEEHPRMIKRKVNIDNLSVARDIANIWIEQRI